LRTRARWGGAAGSPIARFGFTLVELLVVIGVVGLLLSLLLPTLSKAKAQANNLACQSNLHQIGQAIQIYVGGSRGVLPFGYWDGTFNIATGVDTGYDGRYAADWSVLLQSVMSPNAGATYDANMPGGLRSQLRAVFNDPEAPPGETQNTLLFTLTQYAVHPRLMPAMGSQDKYLELGVPAGVRVYLRPYRVSRIRRSSEIAMVFDASLAPLLGGGWSVFSIPVGSNIDGGRLNADTYLTDQYNLAAAPGLSCDDPIDMTPQKPGPINQDVQSNSQNIRFRHLNNRICNVLMADMHVQSYSYSAAGQTDFLRQYLYVNP
jgi:prepilin-type N-terminal cleavage/methylation domain-containing protein